MRNSILMTMIMLPLLAVATYAADNGSFAPATDASYGYSSEDWGSGSYLGVDTRDITPDRLPPLQLKDERGVEVTMVDQDAPAGKAGLKEHDVILTLNGTDVQSVEQLRRMIRETPPGRVVTLGVSRDGQAHDHQGRARRSQEELLLQLWSRRQAIQVQHADDARPCP